MDADVWLRTIFNMLRVLPEIEARRLTEVDRQFTEHFGRADSTDRQPSPSPGERQRELVRSFCKVTPYKRLAAMMRDNELRQEFRDLLDEIPLVRDTLREENPFLLGLVDSNPPLPRSSTALGQKL